MMPATPPSSAAQPDLSQLKDIHLPNAIHDWPIAFGWWLLLAVIIISVITALYFWQRKRKKDANKKAALTLLERQYVQFKANNDSLLFLQQSNQILKRFCLQQHPSAVSLSGLNWANYLPEQLSKAPQKALFNDSIKNALAQGLYQQQCQFDAHELYQACSVWLKNNIPSTSQEIKGSTHD